MSPALEVGEPPYIMSCYNPGNDGQNKSFRGSPDAA